MRRLSPLFALLTLFTIPTLASAQSTRLRLEAIDGDQAQVGELFAVSLSIQGEASGQLQEPDWGAQGWSVRQRSTQRSFMMGMGASRSETTYTLYLEPLKQGRLTIGPFSVESSRGRVSSNTLQITVAERAPAQRGVDGLAFIRWERAGDEAKALWLGERVRVDLYLYTERSYRLAGFRVGELKLDGFLNEQIEDEVDPQLVRIGRNVYRRQRVVAYHLYPLEVGGLDLAPVEVELGLQRGFRQRSLRLAGEALSFTVRSRPAPPTGAPTVIPVGALSLRVMTDRRKLNEDDALQLTIISELNGLLKNTPELEPPSLEGWRVFPSKSRVQEVNRGGERYQQRIQRWLLKPLRSGRLEIPKLSLDFFDPTNGQYQRAESAPLIIQVRPSQRALNEKNHSPSPPATTNSPRRDQENNPNQLRESGQTPLHQLRIELKQETPLSRLSPTARLIGLFTPPLLTLFFLLFGRWSRRERIESSPKQQRRLERRALQRLFQSPPRESELGYTLISRHLIAYLAAWTESRLSEGDPELLDQMLEARGVPPKLRERIRAELENANFARFAPYEQPAQALTEALERALSIIDALERYREETR
ncbi:MAG: BatD family protein [Myxococcota bacterium]|nr:BatD family protein [Myxococcota bacterium]